MAPLDIKQLQALSVVLQAQSFDKAAKILHLTQSAVSQRIKQLEDQLGQPLIIRANPLAPTKAGQQVLRRARQISLLQDELWSDLGHHHQVQRNISIGLNADSLATWFLDAVTPVMQQHDVLLELKVDDQDQTHKLLKSGEVMGCISASGSPMQGCRCEYLGGMRYFGVASREFVARHFSGEITREALLDAPKVEFNSSDQLMHSYLRQYYGLEDEQISAHAVPSSECFVDFIGRGLAWGMLPEIQLAQWQNKYEWVNLTPAKSVFVPLYWHSWNLKSSFIGVVSRAIVGYAASALEQHEK